ncbi:MAG TPA: hypothetical protein VGK59_19700 [Ohtaekwangia sp.]
MKYITLLMIGWLCSVVIVQAQTNCVDKVGAYIRELKSALVNFIPDPGSDEARNAYLLSLKKINPDVYRQAVKIVQEGEASRKKDDAWLPCFQQEFFNIDPSAADTDISLWMAHIAKSVIELDFTSPEFRKGFGVHLDINQGVADLGQKTEAYSFSTRALLAYTFGKDGKSSGGRWRTLTGVSMYYQNTDFLWLINPRIEYRLLDIGVDLTNIGNLKLIADANFGDTWIAGGGFGLELSSFGMQMLYQRQGEDHSSHVLLGVFYRFQKRK